MKLEKIELLPGEAEVKTLGYIKVQNKGIGPGEVTFGKCRLLITNKRIIVAQKILLSKKHQVRLILWTEAGHENKVNLLAGNVEATLEPAKVSPEEVKGNTVTLIKDVADVYDYVRIHCSPAGLGL